MSVLFPSSVSHAGVLGSTRVSDWPDLGYRFKRVGPNAMRGRGIGAARGRATIQRGESDFFAWLSRKQTQYGSEADDACSERSSWDNQDESGCQALSGWIEKQAMDMQSLCANHAWTATLKVNDIFHPLPW